MMNLTSSSKMSFVAPARAFSGAYSLSGSFIKKQQPIPIRKSAIHDPSCFSGDYNQSGSRD